MNAGARRFPTPGVGGPVRFAAISLQIRLSLHDAARSALMHQNLAQQRARHGDGAAFKEGAREDWPCRCALAHSTMRFSHALVYWD